MLCILTQGSAYTILLHWLVESTQLSSVDSAQINMLKKFFFSFFLQFAAKQRSLSGKTSNARSIHFDQFNCGLTQAEIVPMSLVINKVQISHHLKSSKVTAAQVAAVQWSCGCWQWSDEGVRLSTQLQKNAWEVQDGITACYSGLGLFSWEKKTWFPVILLYHKKTGK